MLLGCLPDQLEPEMFEALCQVEHCLAICLLVVGRCFSSEARLPCCSLGAFACASEQAVQLVVRLPFSGQRRTGPAPEPHDAVEEPNGPAPAVRLGQQDHHYEAADRWPAAQPLSTHQDQRQVMKHFVGESRKGSGRHVVHPFARVRWEGQGSPSEVTAGHGR